MRIHKMIVTNVAGLRRKYGRAGLESIQSAVSRLIACDRLRRIRTVSVNVVTDPADARQNKITIDRLYRYFLPDYLMILGSRDVIPHQDLKNHLYSPPNGDPDEFAYGDLPYACEAPYSQNIADFARPARVVGRLPDLTGAQEPHYLLHVLKNASEWRPRPRASYRRCLGISAQSWEGSTSRSLLCVFDSDRDLHTCPAESFRWRRALLRRRMHLINCHGVSGCSRFIGESATDGNDMPVAHDAAYVTTTGLREGTVAAAECCFGGELYDPARNENLQMAMCNTYLWQKAYGFFASTNGSYGPLSTNDYADLICQYFMQSVLSGASLGRAALEARQKYVARKSPLNLTDQKTLAQFNLYGDPSITPVEIAARKSARREAFRAIGAAIGKMQPQLQKMAQPEHVSCSFRKAAEGMNLEPVSTFSFRAPDTEDLHVCVARPEESKIPKWAVLEGREVDGKLVIVRAHSK